VSYGKSAFIVEDEPIIGFALEDMLRDLGFEQVHLSTTMADARRYLENNAPDVAILDVNIHGERSYPEHPPAFKSVPTLTKPYNLNSLRTALAAVTGS
jgi:DNA-binding NtrC family response regulator